MKDTKIDVDWEISEFDPKDLSDDEIKEFYEFYLERHSEIVSISPPSTFEAYKKDFKHVHPSDFIFRFVVKSDGELVAVGNASTIKPTTPAPEVEKEKSWMDIKVKKEWRKKGVGKKVLRKLLDKISEYPVKKIFIESSLGTGKTFCKNLGGKVFDSYFFNYLNLKTLDLEKIEKLNQTLSKRTPGIVLKITNGLKEEDKKVYFDLYTAFIEEMSKSSDEWNFDEESFCAEHVANKKSRLDRGEVSILMYARTKDGTIVGMSELVYNPGKPQEIYSELSGIVKEFRGMGLCKRMKTELFLFIKKEFPQVTIITTANGESNKVMRKINDQLGFESLPVNNMYSFKKEDLKGRLQDV